MMNDVGDAATIEPVSAEPDILRRAVNQLPSMIGCWNIDLHNTFANNVHADYFGLMPDRIRGMHIQDVLGVALYELNLPHIRAVLGGEPQQFERTLIDARGVVRTTSETYVPDVVNGVVAGFTTLVVDVSDRVEAERQRDRTVHLFRIAMENAPIGKAVLTTAGRWLQVNRALCDITGYSADELRAMSFRDITHPDDIAAADAHLSALVSGSVTDLTSEKRYIRKDGTTIWVQRNATVVRDIDGGDVVIAQIQDITTRKIAEEELSRQAVTDDLTGLANRRYLMSEMAGSTEQPLGVVYIDVDGFKSINDTFGHVVGDMALAEIGHRLDASIRNDDSACRVGGDEFVVLVRGARSKESVVALAERIRVALSGAYRLPGYEMSLTVSVGSSWSENSDTDAMWLLRDADRDMYRRKHTAGPRSVD